ncbi:hypothetical protein GCM10025331_65790 [Actinoplanes utahensis]|uniref:Uncharacterized protein n=1 Tax=Actinoplanes utahensis TaxID=1869 RepID=A0A0A6UTR6_ACTUT|nr:hypothetical protein MB27_08500 [Actinoplanes utahensis]GIF32506.1 hypothetical protein Aut01nite_54920 [Actinoplanes utahensis]
MASLCRIRVIPVSGVRDSSMLSARMSLRLWLSDASPARHTIDLGRQAPLLLDGAGGLARIGSHRAWNGRAVVDAQRRPSVSTTALPSSFTHFTVASSSMRSRRPRPDLGRALPRTDHANRLTS